MSHCWPWPQLRLTSCLPHINIHIHIYVYAYVYITLSRNDYIVVRVGFGSSTDKPACAVIANRDRVKGKSLTSSFSHTYSFTHSIIFFSVSPSSHPSSLLPIHSFIFYFVSLSLSLPLAFPLVKLYSCTWQGHVDNLRVSQTMRGATYNRVFCSRTDTSRLNKYITLVNEHT